MDIQYNKTTHLFVIGAESAVALPRTLRRRLLPRHSGDLSNPRNVTMYRSTPRPTLQQWPAPLLTDSLDKPHQDFVSTFAPNYWNTQHFCHCTELLNAATQSSPRNDQSSPEQQSSAQGAAFEATHTQLTQI